MNCSVSVRYRLASLYPLGVRVPSRLDKGSLMFNTGNKKRGRKIRPLFVPATRAGYCFSAYQLNDAPTEAAVSLELVPAAAVSMIWFVTWALSPSATADLLLKKPAPTPIE